MVKKDRNTKFSFRGKVGANAKKGVGNQFGYLLLPRILKQYKETPGGRAQLDFIPYRVKIESHPDRDDQLGIALPGDLWWKRPFRVHRNVGIGNETIVCPQSVGRRCPICEYRATRQKAGAEKDELSAMNVSYRNLYIVVPFKDRNYDAIPHVWDISQHCFQNLLTDELDENDDCERFPDLEEGLTVRVRFESKTFGDSKYPYADANRIDFEEREKPYSESILEGLPDLDSVLKVHDLKKLDNMFFETGGKDEEEEVIPDDQTLAEMEAADIDKEKDVEKSFTGNDEEIDKSEVVEDPLKEDKKSSQEKESSRRSRTREKAPDKEGESCPFNHKFGVDTEKFEECNTKCSNELWDKCILKQDENKAAGDLVDDDIPF